MNKRQVLETLRQTIEQLEAELSAATTQPNESEETGFLKFTSQEISKMPKNFRKTFRLQGAVAHIRRRVDKRYKCSYEIRYAKKPYDKCPISVSGTTIEIAKARFIEKLNVHILADDASIVVPTNFDEFATYWFENFHKRKASEKYYKNCLGVYRRHIKEKLQNFSLAQINPALVQKLLENCPGNGKTADDVHNILNQVFDSAVKHGLIKLNPLDMCFYERHETTPGVALTKQEEQLLLNTFADTEFCRYFAVILYTGLRPNEYPTATIDGQFIKAKNSKRHGKKEKIEYKRIPITPMLRPYLENVENITLPRSHIIAWRFKKLFPQHTLKDMRMTFQTRCDQCKIPDKVIGLYMGNSIGGNLKKAYTDLENPEYLQYLYEEGQKLNY